MTQFRKDIRQRSRPARAVLEVDLAPAKARARAAWDQGEALAASGDQAASLAWLERAARLAPADQNLRFSLAWQRFRTGDAAGSAALFGAMAQQHNTRECWIGYAAALLHTGQLSEAVQAVRTGLGTTSANEAWARLAQAVAQAAGQPGWCGLRQDGVLLTDIAPRRLTLALDAQPVEAFPIAPGAIMLPDHWRAASLLSVEMDGQNLLGSPIDLLTMFRLEGFVTATPEGAAGWAWHPNAPDLDPALTLLCQPAQPDAAPWQAPLIPSDSSGEVDGSRPLARPRHFACAVPPGATLSVRAPDGRDLFGSPLPGQVPMPPSATAPPTIMPDATRDCPIAVIIPVYRGYAITASCLDSVIASVAAPHRIIVVDDAAPEPALRALLAEHAARGEIELIQSGGHGRTLGYPACVNAGLRAATGHHVVLLNSDTLVPPHWLEGLHAAACSAPDIGTATPLSNEASIFSYPKAEGGTRAPDLPSTRALARQAATANASRLVDVPTAHGFCMFIRHDCLTAVGPFEAALFAQGYGEENDFCERATLAGWRHVAVPGLYVAHHGGTSFGTTGRHLLARNLALLQARHPHYAARVADFLAADPLAPARRRLDSVRWRHAMRAAVRAGARGAVLLITHGGGGGTTRAVGERAACLRAEGFLPVILRAAEGLCVVDDGTHATPNLRYDLPGELRALARLLAQAQPVSAELHHLLGHHHSIVRLFKMLDIPYDVWVHDYAWFCARMSFINAAGKFCGEAETSLCGPCLAQAGREIEDPIAPAALRRRSDGDLRGARAVVVPSEDVARRVSRHVPGLRPLVRPWEAPPTSFAPAPRPQTAVTRILIAGAIGVEKGFDVVLACARDAAARDLKLEFVITGYTVDDDTLLQTERVFITGPFAGHEATALITAQQAHLAFLPSIWPETWCYALSEVWAAGLNVVTFDIGTPATRVRQSGLGWVLPLGLPPHAVNNALVEYAAAVPGNDMFIGSA